MNVDARVKRFKLAFMGRKVVRSEIAEEDCASAVLSEEVDCRATDAYGGIGTYFRAVDVS